MSERARGRKAPRQERSRQLVGALVEATIDLLRGGDAAAEGSGFSMRDLAKRAGVGIGSIYDYFSDRDEILDAVVDHLTQANFERLRAGFERKDGAPLEEALEWLMDETFATYLEAHALTLTSIRAILRFGRAEFVVAERDRFVAIVAARVVRDLPRLDRREIELRTAVMTDMLFGAIVSSLYRPPDERRLAVAREVMHAMVLAELRSMREADAARDPNGAAEERDKSSE